MEVAFTRLSLQNYIQDGDRLCFLKFETQLRSFKRDAAIGPRAVMAVFIVIDRFALNGPWDEIMSLTIVPMSIRFIIDIIIVNASLFCCGNVEYITNSF